MPSIVAGFEYDIFISYRHKDNKGAHWVTGFVNALKTELGATFKEDISIYFDENPHDGLLETHNVDKSLEGKLKCLIFIPIISQTYCDPRSFAWQHELCAFNKQAKGSQFGRDIELFSGNVASRILPIKIHDLEPEDKELLENELGSALRAIEFIYREPGVNRPLKSADSKTDNQNRTDFRNQVNKVANAIKDIIQGIRKPGTQIKSVHSSINYPKTEKSIAVLPFVNMSNDPEQEYFSDGMSEEILNSLSHLEDLKVAGRTSSFQFKGRNFDLREVGEKLHVQTVLEGSVRKQGNRLRITAQLINVEDGFHIWSDKYDRTLDDVFAIQDEIALAITEQLKIKLLDKNRELITKSSTQSAEAYEYYLKGRFHINRRGSSILIGLKCFEQAIAIDPGFALAYTGYADAWLFAGFHNFHSCVEISSRPKQAAETAMGLDGSLGEPYCSLALYNTYEWNWAEAKKNFLKAIELNPRYAQSHSFYGMILLGWVEGKFDEAEKHGRIAIKLEPLSAIDHADLAWTLYGARRFEEALAFAKTGVELDSNSFLSRRLAGLCYMALGRNEEAIDILKHIVNKSNRHQHAVNSLIWAYCCNGNIDEAEKLMRELEERSVTEYIAGTHLAMSVAYLGDIDRAFNHLEQAYNDHDPIILQIKYSPFVPVVLKNDPRFQDVVVRIGFPE